MLDNALAYFYEAANLGSMRLASEKIGVAVSSISRQIAQLEQELGTPLIERGRRSIRLTEAGRMTVDFYRDQLADREALMNRLRDLREMKTGRIDLAVGEGFLGRSFSQAVDAFQRRNPGIALSVLSGTTSEIVRMVLEDEAHIGMIFHTSNEPKIRTRASIAQPLEVLCAPTHPAAAFAALTLQDLKAFRICLPPPGFGIRRLLGDAEKRAQTWLDAAVTTTSLHLMRDLARWGRVVTVLPRIAAVAELEEGALVSRPLLDAELEHSTVSLIHRMGRQLDGAPARLLGQLEARLKTWTEAGR
ncbi:LysR family transcriptional regulator [Sphingomonas nostoxanthinifaciens]|uniref:LysR family transcriptional regulator n=1 Tax=Sphingomonas nostoxanthinifaciens TaxID=2872652 RepID=UPI001CC1FF49|nr:LysR family transcriptional regulator [Sphingomonas nostoxanthinifaciens]UAK22920.1 LysR family transcriptional regulator [Sphingomonas nostoxanthinifaciens]